MKKTSNFYYIVWVLALFAFGFAGCAKPGELIQTVSVQPSQKPEESSSAVFLNTDTPSPTAMQIISTPTKSLTNTPKPTAPAPRITFSPLKAKDFILKLLENNGQCRLPCVWGFTPGKTDLRTIRTSLAQFASFQTDQKVVVERADNAMGTGYLKLYYYQEKTDQPYLDYAIDFYYDYVAARESVEQLTLDLSVLANDNIVYDPDFNQLVQTYLLPQILSGYGVPSSVLVVVFPKLGGDTYEWPMLLLIIYEKDGFMVEYQMIKEHLGNKYQGCPSKSSIIIRSWAPLLGTWEDALPERERFGMSREDFVTSFKSLEQATSLPTAEFYEVYKAPDNRACLQTPVSLWPDISGMATRTPVDTPKPTSPPQDAKRMLLELVEKNNNLCRLPCIWGITPKISSFEDTKTVLTQFRAQLSDIASPELQTWHTDLDCDGVGCGNLSLDLGEGNLHYRISFDHYYPYREPIDQLGLQAIVDEDVDVLFGDPYYNQLMKTYSLPQILFDYGMPSSVWVEILPQELDNPFPWRPFTILLIYEKDGFMVEYLMERQSIGNQYQGCPSKALIALTSWETRGEESWKHALYRMPSLSSYGVTYLSIDYLKLLEEATSLTLDEFYQTYQIPDNQTCLQTPASLWPDIGP